MSWTSIFDNTNWKSGVPGDNVGGSGSCIWTGSVWAVTSDPSDTMEGVTIANAATWNAGYRPAFVRVTMAITSGGTQSIALYVFGSHNTVRVLTDYSVLTSVDTSSTQLVYALTYPDGTSTYDITDLGLYQPTLGTWTADITNIEFGSGSSPTAFWTDKVKCSESDS